MPKSLSIGKYRALQRASSASSHFEILAIDHQDALRRALNPDSPMSVTAEELVSIKAQVVSSAWDQVSGVLLDPLYGAAQLIAHGLPKELGLLAELEKADYNMEPLPLAVEIRPGWSVDKIKRMGADGVKLFYYYDPDNAELSATQDATLSAAVADCQRYDIPLYAEPIMITEDAAQRPDKLIRAAQRAEALGADVLKLEFPVDVAYDPDPQHWQSACEALTQSISVPWVLLSAGVRFDVFAQQLEVACAAGASGFIVGRAVWDDACTFRDDAQRMEWLRSVGRERIARLSAVVQASAQPWTACYTPEPITPGWFAQYSGTQ